MMRSRLFLRNSAKAALNSLIQSGITFLSGLILIALPFLSGCSSDTPVSYSTESLPGALTDIAKKEHNIDIVCNLVGRTLWIYLPIEESIFIESDEPQEYTRNFELTAVDGKYYDDMFIFNYDIRQIPEKKESQKTKYNPKAFEIINKVLRIIPRVFFSLERSAYEPRFFVIVTTDIKSGIDLIEITYIDDLKKTYFEMISWIEYQNRSIQDIKISPKAVNDTKGSHLYLHDVPFHDFISSQIKQRIQSKFSGSALEKNADIDKEILKTIKYVFEIYKFKDFLLLQTNNLITGEKTSLSRAAALEGFRK